MTTPLSESTSQPESGAAMPHLLARVTNLTVSFPSADHPAVNGVSLTVHRGECVALVGESGSGKSLTARAILGLLPTSARSFADHLDVPDAAGISVQQAPSRRSREWPRIRGAHSALVPQDALGSLDPLRRVEHEVGDSLRLHRLASGAERRDRVVAALTAAGMPEPESRLRQRSDELSGGLRQRALVASALIADPRLIIADEPTTALDAGRRDRVLQELRNRTGAGAGVLLITHDLTSVLDIADRVHVMRDGRIIEEGHPRDVLRAPNHPFTKELLAASPAGKPRGSRLVGTDTVLRSARPPTSQAGAAGSTADDASAHATTRSTVSAPLVLESISVTYSTGRSHLHHVLTNASIEVTNGETVGLVGDSGSGKTTLLRVALGLLVPTTGSVTVSGVDWYSASAHDRRMLRKAVSFVPQDPLDSFPTGASGRRILGDALRAGGTVRSRRAQRIIELADEVELPAQSLLRPASELSGGQRQRLAIARALARDPHVLLLDEPVSALDATVQARVLDLLDDIQAERGTGMLLVSHDRDVITHMSDRVLRIVGGRVISGPHTPSP